MKRRALWILTVLACLSLALCGIVACAPEGGKHEATGIAITTAPTKTAYTVGDTFDPTGMVVKANYSDDTSEVVTDYTYAPTGALKKTDAKVVVTWNGFTATQKITVTDPPAKEVSSIEVTHMPNKTSYYVGDTFDRAGMVVTAHYTDNTSEVVTNYNLNVTVLETAGKQDIVVTYEGITTKFTVDVAKPLLVSIVISEQPTWTLYNVGEKFNPSGMKVVANYENESHKVLADTDYTYDDKDLAETDTEIVISYTEDGVKKEASVTIEVKALTLTGITVKQAPYNTEYSAGDYFDVSGLIVYAVYNNNESIAREITGWEIVDLNKALGDDTTKVIVRYETFTADINIIILPKYIFEAEAVDFEVQQGTDTTKLAISRGMEYGNVKSVPTSLPEYVNWNLVSGTGFLNAAYSDVDVSAFVLNVTAASAGKATILFRVAARPDLLTAGEQIPLSEVLTMLSVNGAEVAVDEHSMYGADFAKPVHFDMKELVAVRNVDLKAGENVIKFNYALKAVNVDYIAIRSAVEVELTAEKESGHNWSDWLVTSVPTATKAGEMYRYCPTCFSREVVTLPANLEGSSYTKGATRAATTYLAGTQTYTYEGKEFTIVTEPAKGTKANNVFDLENAVFDSTFNTEMGIPVPGIDSAVNAKGTGAHKFNVGGGGDNGGGRFTFTVYSSIAATTNFGVHVARNNTRVLNAAFNFRISVNGKPVALDPNMHCGTADGSHNSTAEAYAKANEGWKSEGGNWKNWIYIVCGTFDLVKGKNTIVVEVLGSPFTNVDDIRLQAPTELVTEEGQMATDVTIASQPAKIKYYEGERFDPEGLKLQATTKSGGTREVKTYTYSPTEKLTVGTNSVTIEAEGKTLTIDITVEEVKGELSALEISGDFKKTYKEGEDFDPTGMIVTAIYSEGGSRELAAEDYEVTMGAPANGKATVTVTSSEVEETFEVTVLMRNIFEAEAFEAEGTGDLRREYEYNVDHIPSGMGYAARPQEKGTYTFHVYNPETKSVTAEVVFNFGQKKSVADTFKDMTVNGTSVSLKNETVDVSGYFTWTETGTLATISLTPGDNVIVLTIGKSRVNFDYVALYSEATLVPTSCQDGHHFSAWNLYEMPTATSAGSMYRFCSECMTREELSISYSEVAALQPTATSAATEYVRGTKTYSYKGNTIVVTSDKATGAEIKNEFLANDVQIDTPDGENIYSAYKTYTNDVGTFVAADNKGVQFTLKVNASEAATVRLVIRAGRSKDDRYPARTFQLSVNDKMLAVNWNVKLDKDPALTKNDKEEKWLTVGEVEIAEFELVKGENTIVLTNRGGQSTNILAFDLYSAATITATPQA